MNEYGKGIAKIQLKKSLIKSLYSYKYFVVLQKLLDASSTPDTQIIMWTSGLTHPDRIDQYLDKSRYIIQVWSECK